MILIGASTGGPGLIERIVTALQKIPYTSIVIAQHMDALSLASFAKRLNRIYLSSEVVLVSEQVELQSGYIYVLQDTAVLRQQDDGLFCRRDDTQRGYYHPTIDMLFESAASLNQTEVVAYLLSGIGADGAKGMLVLKKQGHKTVAQDKESSIVYGMPKSAVELGASRQVMSIDTIITDIQKEV